MFPRSAQAPCRLTARRRLALGGLVMTSALAVGAFVSTPAFADPANPTIVMTADDLQTAIVNGDPDIQLGDDIDTDDAAISFYPEINSDTTIDLHGEQLSSNQISIDDGVSLTVTDSTTTDDARGDGLMNVYTDGNLGTTAVVIGDDSTFHVTGATVFASGEDDGAGIGTFVGTDSHFIADGNAYVQADGDYNDTSTPGGAGIGGSRNGQGLDVTVDDAHVIGHGGTGAAGIGGGDGGNGGDVTLINGGSVDAQQGAVDGSTSLPASSIGAGQEGATSGTLSVGADSYLNADSQSPLVLRTGAVVENAGRIYLSRTDPDTTNAVLGVGTIHNLGTVTGETQDANGDNETPVDPTTLIDSGVAVTGYNYNLALDANGGTITSTKPTSGHLLSDTASDLVGDEYGDYSVAASSAAYGFTTFNTQANGSGTDLSTHGDNSLAGLATSPDGTPVSVVLYAQYARIPYQTATTLPDATVGVPYRAALPVAGDGLNYYFNEVSADPGNPIPGLPAGLTYDATTGVISGTPTEAVERDVIFDVGGKLYTSGLSFHISVGGVPVFGTATLPSGTAGTAYSTTIAVSGGPATYAVAGGALPTGLALNGTTGAITGTPSASSTASFTIRATNRYGSADRAFGLTIAAAAAAAAPAPAPAASAAPAPAPAKPVLTTVPKTTVKFGHALTLAVTANSTLPVTFKLTDGSLPKGITLNTKTGLISGTADATGTFTAEVTATSTAGSATTKVVIVVPAIQQLIDTKGSVPAVKAGAGTVPIKVAGFKKGEKWTVRVDGKLVDHGKMKKAGSISVKVHLPKAKNDKVHTIRIAGSRKVTDPAKSAATTIKVTSLAAKKTLKVHTVSANGTKLVAVEKLAAGERVVIRDKGKVIAKGHANAYGIFTFPSSKAGTGTSKITVKGAAAKRAGKLTVKNTKS